MSLGGRGDSFSFTLHRVRRQMADVVSGYLSMIDEQLPAIIARLRSVQIINRPASEVIRTWDGDDGSEAKPAVDAFLKLSKDDREALLRFVSAL